ncbi:hypothetical protein LSTR_LSTR012412 [Laodelphax striatellus]|uniref:Ig-like domain-containing protein n=1 Tax=Laodelphax striatellus TaxID=195883 RepID=A0A482X2U1_LAOST|nr:hypothetical protein LSTR_LSTR012412 [Laodelphax striatellus]
MFFEGRRFGHIVSWILIILFAENKVGHCLNLTNFEVPSLAEYGSSVTLTCEFDVGSATLNSVKWYKEEHEFFRYMPSNHLTDNQIFPLDGINLDKSISDQNHVTLMHLSFSSSGTYKCEVSTDLPDFKITYRSKHLSVISSPKWGPNITGLSPYYAAGQMINLNCSVGLSYPEPRITWYINGRKVGRHEYIVFTHKEGMLVSAWSTLSYETVMDDFQNKNKIEIQCEFVLGDMNVTEKSVSLASRLMTKKSVQESALQSLQSSGDVCANNRLYQLLAITCILLYQNLW